MTSTADAPETYLLDTVSEGDLPEILTIEADAFLTPWQVESFREALSRSYALFLALRDFHGRLVGYALSWLVADELHILKFAVEKNRRRCGLGRQLLEATIRKAKANGATIAWLEVRPTNDEALGLYESNGFKRAYTRRNYYTDTGEDAVILVCNLADGEAS
jgi:[ribosomal protein S18]-alanine N-acetyltransferase